MKLFKNILVLFYKKKNVLPIHQFINYKIPTEIIINPNQIIHQGKVNLTLELGTDSIIDGNLIYERDNSIIKIGNRTFFSGGSSVISSSSVEIGNDVLISWGVTIVDHNSHSIKFSERKNDVVEWKNRQKNWDIVEQKSVKISDKVWIGFNSTILKGVFIGEGSIIAANSVVTKNVEEWSIFGGNPAKLIRKLNPDER